MHINIHAPVKGIYRTKAPYVFAHLDKNNIKYVVLRWYEKLPLVEPGEDFDILVSNEDCKRLNSVLKAGSVSNLDFIKCDIYPVNNTKGFLAYYPPFLAERCLNNRLKDKSGVWILNPATYFFALTYHAVFHKGYSSGLESKYEKFDLQGIEHDYNTILRKLANEANLKVDDFSLEGLEQFLRDNDWVPPMDIYFRRSQRNPWIADRLKDIVPEEWYQRKGLACFVLRELGDTDKWYSNVCKLLEQADAKVLFTVKLTDKEKEIFSKYTRGGDWGKGPFKKPGGLPSRIIIAKKDELGCDILPHGVVEYEWVKRIKEEIREKYNKSVPYSENSNILHSTDNGVEASYYISILERATGNEYEKLL